MARIELKNLAHSYDSSESDTEDYALKELNHVWEDGGAYALLGPSGCGKTTLLNIISGLIKPSEGRVIFDDRDVTGISPKERNIAQVFQFPVIYDSMTVYENLAFPLKNRKIEQQKIAARVQIIAEMLELTGTLERKAKGLTADAKQTISLGRGLVREDVSAILFDEPLTVIDPHLKWKLRRKLRQIHEQLRLTFIYVTHDQNEALTFAEKVVVMNEGSVLQLGTPQELFEEPAHTFVGHFIGSPGMNLIPCQLNNDQVIAEGHLLSFANKPAEKPLKRDAKLEIGVRPEFLELDREAGKESYKVNIIEVEDLGNYKIATVRFGDKNIKVKVPERKEIPSDKAYLRFPTEFTKLYADGVLIR